jgi:hypothetical protein
MPAHEPNPSLDFLNDRGFPGSIRAAIQKIVPASETHWTWKLRHETVDALETLVNELITAKAPKDGSSARKSEGKV